MEDSVIGFGTLPTDKFKLFQLLSPSIESHRAFHHILPPSTAVVSDISAPESEFSEDITCLINTVISNADASDRETPLSFNFDVSDSKTRLTMQALYIIKSFIKTLTF